MLVQASGKMVLLHKLLPKLRAEGHKVSAQIAFNLKCSGQLCSAGASLSWVVNSSWQVAMRSALAPSHDAVSGTQLIPHCKMMLRSKPRGTGKVEGSRQISWCPRKAWPTPASLCSRLGCPPVYISGLGCAWPKAGALPDTQHCSGAAPGAAQAALI